MNEFIGNEPLLRGLLFLLVLATLLPWERRAPLQSVRSLRGYLPNILLFLINTGVQRVVSMYSLVGISLYAEIHGLGVLNLWSLPVWLSFACAVVVLDLGVYLQHRLFHLVPWFWRLHAVHHSDTCFDVSTGVRFHLGEILLSLVIKSALVLALGAPVWAVLVFEVLLSSASLFTHANVRIAAVLEPLLRLVLVTPDMHRIHHSVEADEYNRNFGFLLSCWDRCLGSYRDRAQSDQQRMPIGLPQFRDSDRQSLTALMVQPFQDEPG